MADDVAELDDLALIRLYRDGDASAFDRIFTRYNQRIRALCARYVGDGQLAEDLVQETFYNVLKTLNRVDDTFHFSAWIYRIAVNLCHDELRRRDKVQHHIEPGGDDVEEAVMRLVDHDRERSPESALEITSMRRVVWEVAKQLPERQRMVLTLRELQGLSYASIAHVMGISQSAVETLLHRARRRFKELYLKQEGSSDSSGDCATVTHILEHIGRRNLRQDQKRMLVNHLEACKDCRARFPARTSTASPSESTPTSTSASAAAGAAG
jgi:RNA polymerase sigma-70 factor (ECF subfamily)